MNYKTIFIVDPVRSDRIQLSKFLKQEFFTIMSFVSITDCFKQSQFIRCDLVIYVLRKGKSEPKHLMNIKKKLKKLDFILFLTPDFPEVNLAPLQENGFEALHKVNNQEKAREITLGLLAPDGIPERTQVPHPVPIGIELDTPQPLEP